MKVGRHHHRLSLWWSCGSEGGGGEGSTAKLSNWNQKQPFLCRLIIAQDFSLLNHPSTVPHMLPALHRIEIAIMQDWWE
jgi:hypothetical protein